MNKNQFIAELKKRLKGLSEIDINKSVDYYGELIDDSVEDGMSEEEAIASLGNIDDIATQIVMDTPITKLVKEKVKHRRTLRVWEIILLVLGSPLWVSLLIAFFSVVLSVYISAWAVVVSLYAVVLSVAVATLIVTVGIFVSLMKGLFLNTLIFLALTLICAGLTILLFIGSSYFAKGLVVLIKLIAKGIKYSFVGRSAK
ncbi:MAG: DUF1700 domain-containing protein [Ruminococcus sp.]|nr:DUF1700 domain-containing protein [Ruminococcus sp.]